MPGIKKKSSWSQRDTSTFSPVLINVTRVKQLMCSELVAKRFAEDLKLETLIPIHTFETESYHDLFRNVRILRNGEVFALV